MTEIECEALPGLEPLLVEELRRRFGAGAPRFAFSGDLRQLLDLRVAHAAYLALGSAGRRPTALLGHQAQGRLLAAVERVRSLHPPGAFASFRLSAAGRDSSTFRRLAEELERATGLRHDPDAGELQVRVRRAGEGWEALLRLSPRPLSARAWRARDVPGALNATIAAAMVELARPRPGDRVANPCCGSGTLLVERLLRCPAGTAAGWDLDAGVLEAARENLAAAGLAGAASLDRADAAALPCPDASFDTLLSDLPYGDLVGSHRANSALYPALLAEAARVAAPDATFVVISGEIRLLDAALAAQAQWRVERDLRVYQGGHRPQVYVLRRRSASPRL